MTLPPVYVPNEASHLYLDNYLDNIGTPLLLYGCSYSGKTTLLTNWIKDKAMFSVIINCNADDKYRHWHDIAFSIVKKIIDKYPDTKYPDDEKSGYFVTDQEVNTFQAAFVKWLSILEPGEDIAIVINDVQLIYDNGISKYFGWLPNSTKEKIHLFVSTNEDAAVDIFKIKEWNCVQMKLSLKDQTRSQIKTYLSYFGKQLPDNLMDKIINTYIGDLPGLVNFVVRYLITNADFMSIHDEIDKISGTKTVFELLQVVYNSSIAKLDAELEEVFADFLCLLSISRVGLNESDAYALLQKSHNIDTSNWAKLTALAESFMDINKSRFSIRSKEVISFINETILSLEKKKKNHAYLGQFHMIKLFECNDSDPHTMSRPEHIKICVENAVEMLWHLVQAEAWPVLYNCMRNGATLYYLSILNWNSVRYVWLNLIINTDYSLFDAYREICDQFRQNIEDGDENSNVFNVIYHKILSLCVDMELRSVADKLAGEDTSAYAGSNDISYINTTEGFTDIYNNIAALNLMRKNTEVIILVEKNIVNRNDIETALLLLLAGEAAVNSGLTEEAEKYADMLLDIAARLSDISLFARILTYKAHVLLIQNFYKASLDMFNKAKMIFYSIGNLNYYLVTELNIARIMVQLRQNDEAEALYKYIIKIYNKTDNKRNLLAAMQYLGNLYHSKNLFKDAYDLYIETSLKAKENDELNIYGGIFNNIALCAKELGNNEEAEKCFIIAFESAKEMDNYYDLQMASKGIIAFYNDNNLFSKALKYIREMQDYLINKGKYDFLKEFIDKEIEALCHASLLEKVKERKEYWEKYLKNNKNGAYKSNSDNSRNYAKLIQNEKLFIATKSIDELINNYVSMFHQLYNDKSFEEAIEVCRRAINAANEYKKPEACQEFLKMKLTLILQIISSDYPEKSIFIVDPDDYKKFIDADIASFFMLWSGIFTDLDGGKIKSAEEKMINIFALEPKSVTNYHLIFTNSMGKIIMNYFSYDLFENIFSVIDSNTKLKSTKEIKEALLAPSFQKMFQDISLLRKNYMDESAKTIVNNCEILIRAGIQADYYNTAALAGNLALIFRRMKNKEKTFEMHELSANLFEADNKLHDSLIEMMNLATALGEFGDREAALNKLREARQKAFEANEEQIHASICGNIANTLNITQGINAIDEIEDMFKIEEHFFRKHSEYRELAISLILQTEFYRKIDMKKALIKFTEAVSITQEHSLREFDNPLRQLSRQLMPDNTESDTHIS